MFILSPSHTGWPLTSHITSHSYKGNEGVLQEPTEALPPPPLGILSYMPTGQVRRQAEKEAGFRDPSCKAAWGSVLFL